MEITTDQTIYWQWRFVVINATLVFSWIAMAVLVVGSALITRNLTAGPDLSRWQNALEVIVVQIRDQIQSGSGEGGDRYLPFIGTLFLFIVTMNILGVIPGYRSPAGSLSTTAGLALCVFVAVPVYGIARRGVGGYFHHYVEPTPLVLPFRIITEISRTVALAVRLFGNMVSTTLVVAILISLIPLFFPVVMELFGLLIGVIQAYVFAVLALVYITSAASAHRQQERKVEDKHEE